MLLHGPVPLKLSAQFLKVEILRQHLLKGPNPDEKKIIFYEF